MQTISGSLRRLHCLLNSSFSYVLPEYLFEFTDDLRAVDVKLKGVATALSTF